MEDRHRGRPEPFEPEFERRGVPTEQWNNRRVGTDEGYRNTDSSGSWGEQTTGNAGRGPKNWRRSEARILEDVNEVLTRHPDVDASEVEVQAADCEVTLSGTVSSRFEKRVAEDCAWRVGGVRDVHNQLKVRWPE